MASWEIWWVALLVFDTNRVVDSLDSSPHALVSKPPLPSILNRFCNDKNVSETQIFKKLDHLSSALASPVRNKKQERGINAVAVIDYYSIIQSTALYDDIRVQAKPPLYPFLTLSSLAFSSLPVDSSFSLNVFDSFL